MGSKGTRPVPSSLPTRTATKTLCQSPPMAATRRTSRPGQTDPSPTYYLGRAGNVTTLDPTGMLGDGSANAPAGTPELPNLFAGEAARPSWEVAGVDYAVGIPTGTVLTDWQNL